MSKRHLPPVAKSDEAYGARIVTGLVCDECGSADVMSVAPGHEGYRVNLLGESSEGPGLTFALTPDRAARGWCVECWERRFGRGLT